MELEAAAAELVGKHELTLRHRGTYVLGVVPTSEGFAVAFTRPSPQMVAILGARGHLTLWPRCSTCDAPIPAPMRALVAASLGQLLDAFALVEREERAYERPTPNVRELGPPRLRPLPGGVAPEGPVRPA